MQRKTLKKHNYTEMEAGGAGGRLPNTRHLINQLG